MIAVDRLNGFIKIPGSWEKRRLKHVGIVISGTGFPPEYQGNEHEELPFLKVSDMSAQGSEKWVSHAINSISRNTAKELGATIVPANAIIYAKIGAALLLNKRRILRNPSCIDNNMSAFVPHAVIPKWALWWMSAIDFGEYVNPGAIPSFTEGQQKELPFLVPPFKDQHLIADYLDRETTRIDALVAEKEKMLALLEEKRTALISRAVTRGLNPDAPLKPSGLQWIGEMPAHWNIRRLKFVSASLDQGSSPIAANMPASPEEIGILKLSAISKGRFRREKNKALRDADGNEQSLSLKKGDILISRGNTPDLVADVACVPNDEPNLLLPDLIYRLRVRDSLILPDFLTYFLTTQHARIQIQRDARGSSGSMVKVSQGHVLDWQTPIPPLSEQFEIVEHIKVYEQKVEKLRNELSSSILLLKERRYALITAAVTGQIPTKELRA